MRLFNASFSHRGQISLLPVTEGGVVRGVVRELFPGTRYNLTVSAVNGAMRQGGVGVSSALVTSLTDSSKLINVNPFT